MEQCIVVSIALLDPLVVVVVVDDVDVVVGVAVVLCCLMLSLFCSLVCGIGMLLISDLMYVCFSVITPAKLNPCIPYRP